MVRPSNPKLMSKVLEAVTHLSESKGSSVRDILQIVKKGASGPSRNLTMQVQRALKHAVTAGILKHRNGRFKAAIALAVTPAPRRRRTEDEYKVTEEMPDVDELTTAEDPFGAVHDRRRRRRRGGSRKRRGSRRRKGRSGRRRRRRGGRKHANDEYEDMAPIDRKKMSPRSRIREDESVENRNHKNQNSDKYSDISGSDHESRHRSRKSKPELSQASRRSSSRSRPKEEASEQNNNDNNRRSSSRHRSQPRNTQAPIEDLDAQNVMDCDDDANDNGADNDNSESKNCGSDCCLS